MKDLTTGCTIRFTENVYSGNYPNAVYEGERTIEGLIVKESYGAKTGQHTFTIKVSSADGVEADTVLEKNTIRRKGRNVYPHAPSWCIRRTTNESEKRSMYAVRCTRA